MIQVGPEKVTPALRALFWTGEPEARRCFCVLDGSQTAGKIITDDPANPAWGIVWEGYEGATFLGGELDAGTLAQCLARLRQEGDVIIGFWLDDPRFQLLPPEPDYDGRVLEFYDRPPGEGFDTYLDRLPEGCELRRLDRDLIMRTEWGPGDVRFAGGIEAWEKSHLGFCLMRGDDILSEATAGPAALGLREPGVFTQEAHRGKGYATIVAARLLQEIDALGERTYWNCAKQNPASAAVARKLGYRVEKEYRCLMWGKL